MTTTATIAASFTAASALAGSWVLDTTNIVRNSDFALLGGLLARATTITASATKLTIAGAFGTGHYAL